MTEHLRDVSENAGTSEPAWVCRESHLRSALGRAINCAPSDIAFTKNTGEAISIVSNGIAWQNGDNVVIADVEFPTNVYPWLALQPKGVEVRFAGERDGRIEADAVCSLIDGRTRAVSLSLVEFASGFRIPAEEIGAYCRRKGVLFVLDVFQALGAIRVDARQLDADVIASAFHKWLLGPEGIGFAYISEPARDRIAVTEYGWKSVTTDYTSFDYVLELQPDARRYECGTLNTVGIQGAAAAMDFYLASGIEAVESRLVAVTDYLCDGLARRGYRVFSPRGSGEKSGIVSFDHQVHSTDSIVGRLDERRIVVKKRAGRVRVAPHYYNTEDEMDRLLDALP